MAKYVQPIFDVYGVAEFFNNVTFDTSVLFDASVFLQGVTHINAPSTVSASTPFALVLESGSGTDLEIKSAQLGTMAFETATDYVEQTLFDTSIQSLQDQIDDLDSSLGLYVLQSQFDSSIQEIADDISVIDASIERIDVSLNDTIDALDLFYEKTYIDGSLNDKVDLAGDTMTGKLTISSGGLEVANDASVGTLSLDGVTISTIDTSTEGLGSLDTAIATSAAIKSYVDQQVVAGVTASNGLTEIGTDIQLGGELTKATTIDISTHSLALDNLVSGTTLLSVISDGGVLKTQQLGDTALMTYSTIDSSITGYVDTQDAAFDSSMATYVDTQDAAFDSSMATYVDTQDAAFDSSMATYVDGYNAIQDASIAALESAETQTWNGLTTSVDNSVGLGGSLDIPTTITTSGTNTLSLAGLQTSTDDTPLALVQDVGAGAIKVRELGDMAWETVSIWDASLSTIRTDITNIETSLGTLNDWNVAQDASIVDIRSTTNTAIQTASNGLTASDTSVVLGGTLDHDTDINTDAYYLSVTGDMRVVGDLTVDGSVTYINSVDLNVSDNIITINYGETGDGVTKTYAGLIVDRGSSTNYFFGFEEVDDTFRIGIQDESGLPANTQAVATREDNPLGTGIPFWNAALNRFDTTAGFTYASGVLTTPDLTLTSLAAQGTETTALMIDASGVVGTRDLGTNAFSSDVYALESDLTDVSARVSTNETSVTDVSARVSTNESSITDLSTGKLDAVASTTGVTSGFDIYSGEADNVAYIKQLVAGSGATITQDSSTVTIGVTGSEAITAKYAYNFTADGSTQFIMSSHQTALGNGPYHVSVYENTGDEVQLGVDWAPSTGNITLSWIAGSLTGDCSVFITG